VPCYELRIWCLSVMCAFSLGVLCSHQEFLPFLLQSITSNLALSIGLSNQFNLSISPEFPTSRNLSVSSLATQSVNCNGTKYRSDLRVDSCLNALNHIPRDPQEIRFSQRGFGHYEVALPSRWISCKCTCCSSSPVRCIHQARLIGCQSMVCASLSLC